MLGLIVACSHVVYITRTFNSVRVDLVVVIATYYVCQLFGLFGLLMPTLKDAQDFEEYNQP